MRFSEIYEAGTSTEPESESDESQYRYKVVDFNVVDFNKLCLSVCLSGLRSLFEISIIHNKFPLQPATRRTEWSKEYPMAGFAYF
jgi:hypothetical protein